MLDFKSKFFRIVAIGAILITLILLLAFSGYYYKNVVNSKAPDSTIAEPLIGSNVINFVVIIFVVISVVYTIWYFVTKSKMQHFANGIDDAIDYVYAWYFQRTGKTLDTSPAENMQVNTIGGNYSIMSFKREGITFEIDLVTKQIMAIKSKTFDTAVKHAEQSDIFKSMIGVNSNKGAMVNDLMRKGYGEKDIKDAWQKAQQMLGQSSEGSIKID